MNANGDDVGRPRGDFRSEARLFEVGRTGGHEWRSPVPLLAVKRRMASRACSQPS
jgi:hypothetical protein